jgi:hypothetical protein
MKRGVECKYWQLESTEGILSLELCFPVQPTTVIPHQLCRMMQHGWDTIIDNIVAQKV